jgi:hypothetical protein
LYRLRCIFFTNNGLAIGEKLGSEAGGQKYGIGAFACGAKISG